MILFRENKGSFDESGKWKEQANPQRETRTETDRVDLEIWDYAEFRDFIRQSKKRVYCLECSVTDVPDNFFVRIFNPHITVQSRDIVFDTSSGDLVVYEKSIKSINAHFSRNGDKLEFFSLSTGKYGFIRVQLQ